MSHEHAGAPSRPHPDRFRQAARPLRATGAALALVAYALPPMVGLVAQVGHGAEHALALLGNVERRAAAMGVTHLHDARNGHDGATYVHAHGGAPHAHDAGVGALLIAADEADEHAQDGGAPAPVELSSHVPAAAALPTLVTAHHRLAVAAPAAAVAGHLLPPPLPPPRA